MNIMNIWQKAREYGKLVVFSNTLFSLSFGLVAIFLAADGLPPARTLALVLLALLAGRTGANAFNRLADRDIDGKNPRTADRHLPAHTLTVWEVCRLIGGCLVVLIVAAALLRPLCLALLPVIVGLIVLYSYSKRFTWLCHILLGVASAAAPVGAFVAIRGGVNLEGWLLAVANVFWVAGFDIIYAIQDMDFDRRQGLHSIPAAFGIRTSMWTAACFHVVTLACLFALGAVCGFHPVGFIGRLIISVLTLLQHRVARAGDDMELAAIGGCRVPDSREFASMNMSRMVSVLLLVVFGLHQWLA